MTVGERIKEARIKRGIKQADFADKIGVSKQTLYKYENNVITNIPSDKIEAAAKVAGVSPAYLMGWETVIGINDVPFAKANQIYNKSVVYDAIEEHFGEDAGMLLQSYDVLNKKGKKEALKRVQEMVLIPEYIPGHSEETSPEAILLNSNFKNKPHLMPDAAHQRTDLSKDELNDKTRSKHDDDIMDDPNF